MQPLYLTYALTLVCFGSISAARVLLSLYALHLGAPASAVGQLVATLYIFPLIISWPIGRFADRVGSRWLLLLGTSCGIVAMSIAYFVHAVAALFVTMTLMGLAFSLYGVLLQNLIGVLSKPSELARNFSNSSLIGATANFAGPLLAGISIDHWGHATACLLMVTPSLAAASLLAVWGRVLPGGRSQVAPVQRVQETRSPLEISRIVATGGLMQVGQDLYYFFIPVYGYAIGLSASAIGSVLATYAAASFVVRFAMPQLVTRLGERKVLVYSFYIAAVNFVLLPFFESALALAIITFAFGLGMGCGQPITTMMLFNRSAEGRSAEVLGLRQTVNNLMRVSGPVIFGFVASAFGLPPVFWISGVIMSAGGLLMRPKR